MVQINQEYAATKIQDYAAALARHIRENDVTSARIKIAEINGLLDVVLNTMPLWPPSGDYAEYDVGL